ncbi:tRNA lysidine(34) synthetase TilS [Sphingosinicella humi]|uniref:tRNA(Ile)-lysidine synthase n=1 Tax=Allosphingosinicella humi TaxID=2068657 RepID=A0A2U2J3T8_9SPHN|nr:tRNA lysidine(34) synthetase TilS [Sphingosinicella humi]PWG02995.1 tRNA lysidine(34) synthetase TilS [Sphingosinicella humi]
MDIDRDTVARFARGLDALAGGVPQRLGLAVSGGPDSLALLLLAHAAWPDRVEAATVDHGLRPESRDEALYVGEICAGLSCPHSILPVAVAEGGAGLQAEARWARYQALGQWAAQKGLDAVATAHHADDQAETLLMRLRRGAGVAGLSGIRAVRREGDLLILRPLLGWAKAELVEIVRKAGVEPIDDPSNRDPRFDRTETRALLARTPWLEPAPLARSAAALAEAEEALEWMATRFWQERAVRDGDTLTLDPSGLPPELARRLLARALAAFGAAPPRGEELSRLLAALGRGETATLAGVKCTGGAPWRIAPAPPRRAARPWDETTGR